jgi:transposase
MPQPISLDLRERILRDVLAGMTYAEAGRKYSVSAEFVRQFHRRYQATQEVAARPPLNRVVPFYRRYETEIRAAVNARPGITLEELRTRLGVPVSIGTLWTALQKLKLTFKKNAPRGRATATGRRTQAGRVRILSPGGYRPAPIDLPR